MWPLQSFKSTVRNWCGLFVSVHNEKLFLIHQTAREFLTGTCDLASTEPQKWEGRLDMAAAHGTMSRICIDYLSFPDVPSLFRRRLDRGGHPKPINDCYLGHYAACNWFIQYDNQPTEVAKSSRKAAKRLCQVSSPQGDWFSTYSAIEGDALHGWTELGVASYLGLAYLTESFLDEGADVNAPCVYDANALKIASFKGHDQVVLILVDKGADVNVQGKHNETALQLASISGREQVVRILLDNGAEVNVQGGSYGHASKVESGLGRGGRVGQLLDKGTTDCDGYALLYASRRGYDRIVRMLLASGTADNNGKALSYASIRHDQIVRMLLDSGATDVDGIALHHASSEGHVEIARMLFDNAGDTYAQGRRGIDGDPVEDAVAVALRKGRDEVVRMLREFQGSAT